MLRLNLKLIISSGLAGKFALEHLHHSRHRFGTHQFGNASAQHFFRAKTRDQFARFVHRSQPALQIKRVNNVIGVLEKLAIALVRRAQFLFGLLVFGDVYGLTNDAARFALLIPQHDTAVVEIAVVAVFVKDAIFGFQRVILKIVEILDSLDFRERKIVRVRKRLPRLPGLGDFIGRVTQNSGKVFAALYCISFQIPIVVETVRSLLGDLKAVMRQQQFFF